MPSPPARRPPSEEEPRTTVEPESLGPLAIERRLKADGRALILYVHRSPAGPGAHGEIGSAGPGASRDATAGRAYGRGASRVSELRFNELRGEQVAYAIHRQDRTFLPPAEHCPLCPTRPGGDETEIPFPAFQIAVFDNKFPAFSGHPPAGGGAAEVVVYTDSHEGSFGTLAPERAEALMWVWRHRYLELASRDDVSYVLIFENRGVEVGVTLHHPHGQIYGYPFLPPVPTLELEADRRLGGCAPCALLRRELHDRTRVVYENEAVLAYVPFAARWPYEAHVVMREHRPSLLDCGEAELRHLATGLQALVRGYDALFDRPFPYVMVVHQAATSPSPSEENARAGHLHVEFYPPLRTAEKLKYLAGSEQGAGTFISDTLPERSARALAEAIRRAA